jgi:hypothetical protein
MLLQVLGGQQTRPPTERGFGHDLDPRGAAFGGPQPGFVMVVQQAAVSECGPPRGDGERLFPQQGPVGGDD